MKKNKRKIQNLCDKLSQCVQYKPFNPFIEISLIKFAISIQKLNHEVNVWNGNFNFDQTSYNKWVSALYCAVLTDFETLT